MNSLIYHTALLIEALFERVGKANLRTVLAVSAGGLAFFLLLYVTLQYTAGVAKATLVVLGSEATIVVLVAAAAVGIVLAVARGWTAGKRQRRHRARLRARVRSRAGVSPATGVWDAVLKFAVEWKAVEWTERQWAKKRTGRRQEDSCRAP